MKNIDFFIAKNLEGLVDNKILTGIKYAFKEFDEYKIEKKRAEEKEWHENFGIWQIGRGKDCGIYTVGHLQLKKPYEITILKGPFNEVMKKYNEEYSHLNPLPFNSKNYFGYNEKTKTK